MYIQKLLYISILMLCCSDIMAQFDPNDRNWDTVFIEDFSGHRYWNTSTFQEGSHSDNRRWECKAYEWLSGVTVGKKKCHAYQPYQAMFCDTGGMKLCATYIRATPLVCDVDYQVPTGHYCDPGAGQIFYHSGMIETMEINCHYGYYEMKCRMPVHDGVKNSFWLYGTGNNTCYEEIDIFEHSEADYAGNINRRFTAGLWRNPDENDYIPNLYKGNIKYHIPENKPDLTHDHVFGLEWMPDYVKWYLDGEVINEYDVWDTIPKNPMTLKIDYQIMNYVMVNNMPSWHDTDTMTISYVKVLKLKTDCNTDTYITTGSQLANFDHKVKRSIHIGTPYSAVIAPTTTDITMRAVDGITIDGEFELPQGAKMTLIVQECPE